MGNDWLKGEKNKHWRGGKSVYSNGYQRIFMPDHPRAHKSGYVPEHILVAENVLGEPLPSGSIVHHIDGNTSNNEKSNLVICQNDAYHQFLHRRKKAYDSCGHAEWRKCSVCQEYDDPKNLVIYKSRNSSMVRHKDCYNKHRSAKRRTRTWKS